MSEHIELLIVSDYPQLSDLFLRTFHPMQQPLKFDAVSRYLFPVEDECGLAQDGAVGKKDRLQTTAVTAMLRPPTAQMDPAAFIDVRQPPLPKEYERNSPINELWMQKGSVPIVVTAVDTRLTSKAGRSVIGCLARGRPNFAGVLILIDSDELVSSGAVCVRCSDSDCTDAYRLCMRRYMCQIQAFLKAIRGVPDSINDSIPVYVSLCNTESSLTNQIINTLPDGSAREPEHITRDLMMLNQLRADVMSFCKSLRVYCVELPDLSSQEKVRSACNTMAYQTVKMKRIHLAS